MKDLEDRIKELERKHDLLSDRYHANILHDKTAYNTLEHRIEVLEKRCKHLYEGMEKLSKLIMIMDDSFRETIDMADKAAERQAKIVMSHSEALNALTVEALK